MSLSNGVSASPSPVAGRIIIGPKSMGLSELTVSPARQAALNMESEEDYLERVRKKAQDVARDILAQAMAEAEQLRSRTRDEGRSEGLQQADQELQKITKKKGQECKALLEAMQQAGQSLWQAHRQDLVLLVQVMVEKILAVELNDNRRQSLENLLDQAVDMMDAKRRVVITVHPRDLGLMEDLLEQARGEGKGPLDCKVKADEGIKPGGLILECDHGMVDNTIASRKAGLQEIVDQLTLEETS